MSLCTYCGAYDGNNRDHVIPVSYTSLVRHYRPGTTVPSCSECNSLLGDKMFVTVPERAAYLYTVLPNRYRHELAIPDWTADDKKPMAKNMVKKIQTAIKHRDEIKDRLDKLSLVKEGFDIFTIDRHSEHSLLLRESNLTKEELNRNVLQETVIRAKPTKPTKPTHEKKIKIKEVKPKARTTQGRKGILVEDWGFVHTPFGNFETLEEALYYLPGQKYQPISNLQARIDSDEWPEYYIIK